jgi:hypothetical protein
MTTEIKSIRRGLKKEIIQEVLKIKTANSSGTLVPEG